MKPINFPYSNRDLSRPRGTTDEECSSLPILQTGEFCISCWQGTWRDRLKFLLTGKCWLSVWSGQTQPPVKITTEEPFEHLVENYDIDQENMKRDHAGETV